MSDKIEINVKNHPVGAGTFQIYRRPQQEPKTTAKRDTRPRDAFAENVLIVKAGDILGIIKAIIKAIVKIKK